MRAAAYRIYIFLLLIAALSPKSSDAANICLPHAIPPYSDSESKTGLHVDIIKAAFKEVGEPTTISFLANKRLEPLFIRGKCEVSGHIKKNEKTRKFHFTQVPMMTFHNAVISKKELHLNYNSPKDLTSLRVAAFQNAHKFLGDEFYEMSQANENYREYGGILPAQLLLLDRIDVVISEPNIFLYYLRKQLSKLPTDTRNNIYRELSWTPFNKKGNAYFWGFHTLDIKEKFEKGLTSLYKNGEFEKIFSHWSKRFNLQRNPLANMDCAYGKIESACAITTRLKVIFGLSRPPFIESSPPSGISWELALEIFRRMGREIIPSFAANARMTISLSKGTVDAAVEIQPTDPTLFYSAPFISYQNFVFLHSSSKVEFKQWSDLAGKKVCAWQGAFQDLGKEFKAASSHFESYREFGEQKHQVQRWMLRSCDAAIIDKTIFFWWVNKLKEPTTTLEANSFPVPGQNELWWTVGFRNKTIRDNFNRHLEASIADGTYDRIRNKYIFADK